MKRAIALCVVWGALMCAGVTAEKEAYVIKVMPGTTVMQGESLVFKVTVPKGRDASGLRLKVFDKEHRLYPYAPLQYTLPMGVRSDQVSGTYNVTVYDGHTAKASCSIIVKKKAFKSEVIVLAPQKKKLATSPALVDEAGLLGGLFREVRTDAYRGHARFVLPVPNPVTSAFGFNRKYVDRSGALVSTWQHRGVDLSGKGVQEIVAADAGKIILVRELVANGNVIMIDHGQGVISVYSHVGQFKVKEGDMVAQGQIVGTIGTSGISTGPHVHWGLSVGNVRVDPMQWVRARMFF